MHPLLNDRYEIKGEIARSRCSVVMLAIDNTQEEIGPIVIKKIVYPLLTPDSAKLVKNEFLAGKTLKSKYIVPYSSIFSAPRWNGYFVTMPYYRSRSLAEQIRRRRELNLPFKETSVWIFLASMLNLLSYLYSDHGTISSHIDVCNYVIRPEDVYVSAYGFFQLHRLQLGKYAPFRAATTSVAAMTFGLSDTSAQSSFTTGRPKLTPCYHAPETMGNNNWSVKSDIWAIACIAYEMCALRPLYEILRPEELFNIIQKTRPRFSLSCYSRRLQDVLSLMLDPITNSRASLNQLLAMPAIQQNREMLVCSGNGVCSCGGNGSRCCDLQIDYQYTTFVNGNYTDAMDALSYGTQVSSGGIASYARQEAEAAAAVAATTGVQKHQAKLSSKSPQPLGDIKAEDKDQDQWYSIMDFSLPPGYLDIDRNGELDPETTEISDLPPFNRMHWRGSIFDSPCRSGIDPSINTGFSQVRGSYDNLLQIKGSFMNISRLSASPQPQMSVDSLMSNNQKVYKYPKDPVVNTSTQYVSTGRSNYRPSPAPAPAVTDLSPIPCSEIK